MKTIIQITTVAVLLAATLGLQAQSNVPERISYQGIVSTTQGTLLGTGTPINREIIFRIWDSATDQLAGNLVYSEKQIVTTAFSFRAKEAETVLNDSIGTDSLSNGSVTLLKIDSDSVGGNQIIDGSIDYDDLEDDAVDSSTIENFSIERDDVQNGAITANKLGADVGLWSVSGANLYRTSGNVGVGKIGMPGRLSVKAPSSASVKDPNGGIRLEEDDASTAWNAFYDTTNNNLAFRFSSQSSDRLVIESGGNVGVGTSDPAKKLEVNGSFSATSAVVNGSLTANSADVNGNLLADRMGFGIGTIPNVLINTQNNPGDAYTLQARNHSGNTIFQLQNNGNAFKTASGGWLALSDERLKDNVVEIEGSLEELLKLRSVTFTYKDQNKYDKGLQRGFIAQEVEKIFPEWIEENEEGYKMLGIAGFEALTVQALRELRTEKDAQIAKLESANADLLARVEAIEKKLGSATGGDEEVSAAGVAATPRR